MTEEVNPDQGEMDLAEQMDNVVPSFGYKLVPVVGLGGSAGSIEALQTFFTTMPPNSGLAFVVVIHLAPGHDSMLTELIQRCTRMQVEKVEGVVRIQPDMVYVIPPGKSLQSAHGRLHLAALDASRARHVAVDIFFRTLADSHGAHAAAILLSGADGDGAIGIKRIKERGGLTVAQDPDQATHPSMPKSAIDTGMIDWVLPVQDMPARVMTYFRMEDAVQLPAEDSGSDGVATVPTRTNDEAELRDVLNFLRSRTGRDFSHYKRATVLRRIGRRMQVNGIDNLPGYLNCLRTRQGECAALLQDLLISVTNFFRDAECFEALESHIPALFENKGPGDTVRAWTIACATGEEAYTLAMLLSEHARTLDNPPMIQVFATDLDEDAVRAAREGIYPATISADVSEDRLRRFFLKEHRGYRVRRELREMVLFAVHDVLKDSPFSRVDLVSCRNLLIYLTRDAQARVFETLNFALVPGGRMFLGASESVDENSPLFQVLDKKHRIFLQRPLKRPGMPMPIGQTSLRMALESHDLTIAPVTAGRGFERTPAALQRGSDLSMARAMPWGEIHLRLLEAQAPPSVLVDGGHDIVHLSSNAGRFLQLTGGEPTRNLMRAVRPELRLELRAALIEATQSKNPVQLDPVVLSMPEGPEQVLVRVAPAEAMGDELYLVTFALSERTSEALEAPQRATRREDDPLARNLDREIERLKTQLRDTVEQYEASTEELKASNEELQAMNEELRSATEELETSREELQSINEELTTVNYELKTKVDELSHANSDMHNLMNATSIATVFLDRDLRITRFTPPAAPLFNLIPGDVGRPLTDLTSHLDYPQLHQDARDVIEQLVPVEREVGHGDGSWYLARLVPYRTIDDRIAGVVFSFIDITERKQAEEVRMWLAAVVASSSDAIISFSLDNTIVSWNAGAESIFGYSAQEAIGRSVQMLSGTGAGGQDAIVAEIAAGHPVNNQDAVRLRKDGSEVHLSVNVSPIRDASGRVMAGTAIMRDITQARTAAESLRQSEERLRMLVESATEYAIFSTDLDRKVTSWNSGAERLLGYREKEAIGHSADMIFTDADRAKGSPEAEADTAREQGRAQDEREHRRKDGSTFRGTGAMMLMRDSAGQAAGFVKILRDKSEPAPDPGK